MTKSVFTQKGARGDMLTATKKHNNETVIWEKLKFCYLIKHSHSSITTIHIIPGYLFQNFPLLPNSIVTVCYV